MKTLAAVALVLICSAPASNACTMVIETRPSSRNARIIVLHEGKPQAKARLTITLQGHEGAHNLFSDSSGVATLGDLQVGMTCILATAESNLRADLCLEVSKQSSRGTSSFNVNLFPGAPPPPSMEDQVGTAEKTLPVDRVNTFGGAVVDPAGAVIPNVVIEIFKHGAFRQGPLTKTKTNQEGRFAASLNPGSYTAIIQMPGFRTGFLIVVISPDNQASEIRKVLQIGLMSTC